MMTMNYVMGIIGMVMIIGLFVGLSYVTWFKKGQEDE